MPTLQELQAAEATQGATRLRTLKLEFADTLARLPKLQQEVETWLATAGVDLADLAQRLEPQLASAADWLLAHDMLPAAAQDHQAVQAFMQRAQANATGRTVAGLAAQFAQIAADAASNPSSAELARHGYVDHGNGTLTDTRTGLMWKRAGEGPFTWDEAIRFNGQDRVVSFAGFTDWRLPNLSELKSLLLAERPYICEAAFPQSRERFWSSSPCGGDNAWDVNFGVGVVDDDGRSDALAVRLVRASQ